MNTRALCGMVLGTLVLFGSPLAAEDGGLVILDGFSLAGDLTYAGVATASPAEYVKQYAVPRDGALISLVVNPWNNTLDSPAVIRLRVNGVDTSFSMTVPVGSTVVQISPSPPVAVTAGDLVSVAVDATGASAGRINANITWEYSGPIAVAALPVPAVSRWGLFALAFLLVAAGILHLRAR